MHPRKVALHHPTRLEAGVAVGTGEVLLRGVAEHHVLAEVALRVERPRADLTDGTAGLLVGLSATGDTVRNRRSNENI